MKFICPEVFSNSSSPDLILDWKGLFLFNSEIFLQHLLEYNDRPDLTHEDREMLIEDLVQVFTEILRFPHFYTDEDVLTVYDGFCR